VRGNGLVGFVFVVGPHGLRIFRSLDEAKKERRDQGKRVITKALTRLVNWITID
jgi:hypothetical protein